MSAEHGVGVDKSMLSCFFKVEGINCLYALQATIPHLRALHCIAA